MILPNFIVHRNFQRDSKFHNLVKLYCSSAVLVKNLNFELNLLSNSKSLDFAKFHCSQFWGG